MDNTKRNSGGETSKNINAQNIIHGDYLTGNARKYDFGSGNVFKGAIIINENVEGRDKPVFTEITVSNLPERNKYFAGRDEDLTKLDELFKQTDISMVNICQTISGLGGVGKTSLAVEYAYRYCRYYENAICFINAENSGTVFNYFLDFARIFGMELPSEPTPDDLQPIIRGWLTKNTNWLIIFDNLEFADDIKPYLPSSLTGHYIITTRSADIDIGTKVGLGVFNMDESIRFLKGRLNDYSFDDFDSQAPLLSERLGMLPLALEQAAAYMDVTKSSITSYLKLLEQSDLDAFEDEYATPSHYESIVTATWQISFDSIILESSKELFNLCAYMGSERIPVAFFEETRDVPEEPFTSDMSQEITKNKVVTELRKYSLISGNAKYINMHRLVQEVVRKQHGENPWWAGCCSSMLVDYYDPEFPDFVSIAKYEEIAHHAATAAEIIQKKYDDERAQETVVLVYTFLAQWYFQHGVFKMSYKYSKEATIMVEDLYGNDHPFTIVLSNIFGMSALKLGVPADAIQHLGRTITAEDEFLHGLREDDINDIDKEAEERADKVREAGMLNAKGVAYMDQGQFDEALSCFDKSVSLYQKCLGEEHASPVFNNIGRVHDMLGDYNQALDFFHKARIIHEAKLGEEHTTTAENYINIGLSLSRLEKFSEAFEYYGKARHAFETTYPKDENGNPLPHPDLANVYNNIGDLFSKVGETEKALSYYKIAMEFCAKTLGEDSVAGATILNNIGVLHMETGNHREAISHLTKALFIKEKILGSGNVGLAGYYNNLAMAHAELGEADKAIPYGLKTISILEGALGSTHPNTITTYSNMCYIFAEGEDYENALSYAGKAISSLIKTVGANHPEAKRMVDVARAMYSDAESTSSVCGSFEDWLRTVGS